MLTYQPFYMGGIDDVDASIKTAYKAMVTFGLTFAASVVFLMSEGNGVDDGMSAASSRRRPGLQSHQYEGVPTNQSGPNSVMHNYALSLELPPSVEQGGFSSS